MTLLRSLGGAVLAFIGILSYELLLSQLRSFPGPFLAKFSDFFRAYLTMKGDVDAKYRQWHRKWGMAVRVGPHTISLSDPSLIKVVYETRNAWMKSDMYRVNDLVVNGHRIQNIFNTQDQHFHSKYTKPIGQFWALSKVLEQEPLMDETLQKFTDKLATEFTDGGNADMVCMMDKWLTYFAWDSAANISFAKDYGLVTKGQDTADILAESKAGLEYFAAVSQIPWLDDWLDKNPLFRIGPRPLVNGFRHTIKMLDEHKKELAAGTYDSKGVPTFLEHYIGTKTTHPDVVDNALIVNWLMLNVVAGGDSTAGALRAAVYCLAKNPDEATALQEELDGADLALPAQWKQICKLPHLDAVIRESQRLYPAVGLMLEREVPEGGLALPDGRTIPARTVVGINPCVVGRDGGLFGHDADEYRPERWFQRAGEPCADFTARRRRMDEAADLMFGAGSRACMGKHMAKMEMYKTVATLYRMFDLRLVNSAHEWKYQNSWFMYQSDIPMLLRRRN